MSEADDLQVALAAEHAAVYAYAVVAARVPASRADDALAALAAHRAARDRLEAALQSSSASPAAAEPGYALPAVTPTLLAAQLEDGVATAYARLLASANSARVVDFAAAQLRDCAVRGAGWRGSSTAFPGLGR